MPRYCSSCGRESPDKSKFCNECGTALGSEDDKFLVQLLDKRYEIRNIVKAGAMGAVYRALDTRLGNTVAVKQMLAYYNTLDEKKRAEERFKEEARILSLLHHGGLPKVIDYFVETDDSGKTGHYLVMTFIEGKDFESFLEDRLPLPVDDVLVYCRQILEILDYLHTRVPPIVYRDIKPSNVMIHDSRIYLVDFGIAQTFTTHRKGTMMGTPGYAAPEQYKGYAEPRSDLYSLGVFMYYLLSGMDPMDSSRPPFVFEKLNYLNHNIPAHVVRAVEMLLEFEVDRRPPSAGKVLEMLNSPGLSGSSVPVSGSSVYSGSVGVHKRRIVKRTGSQLPGKQLVPFTDYQDLFEACKVGDVSLVRQMLDQGADPDTHNDRGWTPVHEAASQGHALMVEMLLEYGADVNVRDKGGRSPLHEAVYRQSPETVEILLQMGADVNSAAVLDLTPLYIASSNGNLDIAEILIRTGADVNARSTNGWAPLHKAAGCNYLSMIELLVHNGADINIRNKEGWTPLHIAIQQGHDQAVDLLIRRGADISSKLEDGKTPMELAIYHGQSGVAVVLRKALMMFQELFNAVERHDQATVELLLSEGVYVNVRDVHNRTPLHAAATFGNHQAAVLLVQYGGDVNARDREGKTPLFLAARTGHADVAALLLQNSARPDLKTNAGWTALHEAAKYGFRDMVVLLLNFGADANISTFFSGKPLDIAERFDRREIVRILQRYTAP